MVLTISPKFYGEQALEIAKRLGLEMSGDSVDVNRKVYFYYKSVEGHSVIEMEVDI